MKLLINLMFLTFFVSNCWALTCYSCDNVGEPDLCIDNPEAVTQGGTVVCTAPQDEYCYISRLEYDDGRLDFNRGCCEVKNGSPVCPEGKDFQIINGENYKKKLTRCKGNLCNNDDGTGTNTGGGNGDGNIIIVDGNSANYIYNFQIFIISILIQGLMISFM